MGTDGKGIGAVLLLAAAAGCSASGEDLDLVDTGRLSYFARATIDLDRAFRTAPREKEAEDEGEEEAPKRKEPSVRSLGEFTLSVVQGEDEQRVDPGDEVEHAGEDFPGPATVESDFTLARLDLLARAGFPRSGPVSVEFLGGISVQFLDLDVDSGADSARGTSGSLGPTVGTQLTVRPFEPLTLYGRGTLWGGLGGGREAVLAGAAMFEGGAEVDVAGLFLFGGWRAAGIHELRSGSDVFLDVSGPFAGIGIRF